MKQVYEYSHLGGSEILQVRYPRILAEINDVIASVGGNLRTKQSMEKTKVGKMLYSPVLLNRLFREGLNAHGFVEKRAPFSVELPNYPVIIRNAFKQIDFTKDGVLVEVQFGKYAFMFYDMAKFQYFFNDEKAEVGVEIVPCRNLQREMSSGVSYGEQLIGDILRLRRHFPAVPVKIILVDVDDAPALTESEEELSEEDSIAAESAVGSEGSDIA
jgi:hypothetical protein